MAIKRIDTQAKNIIPKSKSEGGFWLFRKKENNGTKKSSAGKFKLFFKTTVASFFIGLAILIGIGLILGILLYPKTKNVTVKVEGLYTQAKELERALVDKDIKKSELELKELKDELAKTESEFNNLSFARYVPVVAGYYSDGGHLLEAAKIGVEIGEKSLGAVEPFGDVLGFKGIKEEADAEKKAQKLVKKVIPSLVPVVDDISVKLLLLEKEIMAVDENRYPENLEIKGYNVRETLKQAKKALALAHEFIPEVKPLLKVAPEIAGEPKEKTYLILLQNDKELRATGGFITSYALVKIKGGKIIETTSDDIYQLDKFYVRTEIAPEAIQKYIGHNSLPLRDANISPDFEISAAKVESFYNTLSWMPKVDGVFALDTEFVRMFLEATGPITTAKTHETFSAEKNFLGIPDVVYKLELHAEKINAGRPDRKGILGELMDALIDRVMTVKPEEFPKYAEVFMDTVEEKHLLFYFHNQVAQNFAEKYNAAGKINTDYESDYVHLNNSNFGGLKGNLYLKQKMEQDIKIAADGTVTKKVDITLHNSAAADGWLNSIYLNWMRLYVPKDSVLVTKQVEKDFTSGEELGKEVFRGYSATYPLTTSVASFTYKLPFKVNPNEPYKMLIQKQPGVDEIDMTIKINGVVKEKFKLRTDKELVINY